LAIDESQNKLVPIEYKFITLIDVPDSYTGYENNLLSVNADGT